MSVYIKGMEMPTSCAECRFCGEYCYAKGDENKYSKLPCPLIPVPEHGRLVDLDEIENEIAQISPEDYTAGTIRLILDCAPTIIPAEEG